MANKQAVDQIELALRTIRESEAALGWLEEIANKWRAGDKAAHPSPPHINPHSQFGSSVNGFKEAELLLNDWIANNKLSMFDGAISAARFKIIQAEEQIRAAGKRI